MRFNRVRLAAVAAAVTVASALAGVTGASAQAAPALTCPTGVQVACFYGQIGFNDDIGSLLPNHGYGYLPGIVGVRNRSGYWLCLLNEANGAKWPQGPDSENQNIGGGWNHVTAKLYFHSSSAC